LPPRLNGGGAEVELDERTFLDEPTAPLRSHGKHLLTTHTHTHTNEFQTEEKVEVKEDEDEVGE
jgi:hypothetical protein